MNGIPNIIDQIRLDSLAYNVWRDKYRYNNETLEETIERCVNVIADKTISNVQEYFKKLNGNKSLFDELSQLGQEMMLSFCNAAPLKIEEKVIPPAIFEVDEYSIRSFIKNVITFDRIIPQGSMLFGLGNMESYSSLSNCFVIGSPHDSLEGIHESIGEMKILEKARGGVGINVSTIRPKGAKVNNQSKTSTGACVFVKEFSDENNVVAQDGRRGALMINLSINHPDVLEFIKLKNDLSKVTGANLSVIITKEFMDKLETGDKHIMRFPIDSDITDLNIDYSCETLQTLTNKSRETIYVKVMNSKELWDAIIYSAWKVAEPGLLFEENWYNGGIDSIYPQFKPISTNPCSEICMGPYDSCRLIAYNLMDIVINPYTDKSKIDFNKLYEFSYYQLVIADQLIDIEIDHLQNIINKTLKDDKLPQTIKNDIVNLYEKIIKNTKDGRRCGCGFLGLADLLAAKGLKISDITSNTIISDLGVNKLLGEISASIDLAILSEPFKDFDPEKDLEQSFFNSIKYHDNNIEYEKDRMKKFGRRNVSFSTVAPTGTISLLTGVTPGIEPLFQPFYKRRVKLMASKDISEKDAIRIVTDVDGQRFIEYNVIHRQFLNWIFLNRNDADLSYNNLKTALENSDEAFLRTLFEQSPWFGQLAEDIQPDKRLMLQSIIQMYTTHAISSTLNLHKDTTQEIVDEIYRKSYRLGLKGNTVYRDGARSGILVKTEKPEKLNKRPDKLKAVFHKLIHNKKIYGILISFNNDKPFEIFILDRMGIIKNHGEKLTGYIEKLNDNTYNFIENESDIESEYDNEINPYLIQLHNLDDMESKDFKVISLFISKMMRENISIRSIIKLIEKSQPFVSEFNYRLKKILSLYIETNEEQCPKCKNKLRNENGCFICDQCGWGKC